MTVRQYTRQPKSAKPSFSIAALGPGTLKKTQAIEVDGKHLSLTNLEKVLYPAAGFTKGQIIDYYARIAPVLLPHFKGRPLTLKRYPEGVDRPFFYEKNAPSHKPDWVQTVAVWSEGNNRNVNYVLLNDLPTLIWVANLASIELHPSLSLSKNIERPTMIVFDLDPGPPADIVQCAQVGLWLREIFEHFGLQSFPKTSGSKGLQVYVPLHSAISYDDTKPFAHALARLLEDHHRDLVVSDMKKQLRVGKVLVDWSQNDEHKTTIGVYSLRAKDQPTVSTPVKWEEVERVFKKKDGSSLVFQTEDVLARVQKMGDLFEPVLTLKQQLPKLQEAAEPEKGIEISAQAEEPEPKRKKSKARRPAAKKRSRKI